MEVELLVQTSHNVEPAQNVNVSTSTMGSTAGVSKFLISPLLTPNNVPLSPPPITNKTTKKVPDIPDIFESLHTFVSSEGPSKEKAEAFGHAKKPSRLRKWLLEILEFQQKLTRLPMCLLDGP